MAARATHVRVCADAIPAYAASLTGVGGASDVDLDVHLTEGTRDQLAAFWLTLDAVNFGSGWFPTLRKPAGRSGYETVALGLRRRFETRGPWPAVALAEIGRAEVADVFGQDPEHELMELFAGSLRDLGRHVADPNGIEGAPGAGFTIPGFGCRASIFRRAFLTSS